MQGRPKSPLVMIRAARRGFRTTIAEVRTPFTEACIGRIDLRDLCTGLRMNHAEARTLFSQVRAANAHPRTTQTGTRTMDSGPRTPCTEGRTGRTNFRDGRTEPPPHDTQP